MSYSTAVRILARSLIRWAEVSNDSYDFITPGVPAAAEEQATSNHIVTHVREHVGPVAAFKLVIFVPALPKTRSGKIARGTLAALADGKPFKVNIPVHVKMQVLRPPHTHVSPLNSQIPPTIEDPNVYSAIKEAMQRIGLAKDKV